MPEQTESGQISTENTKPRVPARETWVNGYEEGNRWTPQISRPGPVLLTLNAVLQDEPADWAEYVDSKLTSEQQDRIGKNLSRMHHNAGVDLAVEKHKRPDDKIIEPAEVQGLWKGAKTNALTVVLSYIDHVAAKNGEPSIRKEADDPTIDYEINRFMHNPANHDAVTHIKDVISTAAGVITDKENTPMIQKYYTAVIEGYRELKEKRQYLNRRTDINDREAEEEKVNEEFGEKIKVANQPISNQIVEKLTTAFPDEDLSWLGVAVPSLEKKADDTDSIEEQKELH